MHCVDQHRKFKRVINSGEGETGDLKTAYIKKNKLLTFYLLKKLDVSVTKCETDDLTKLNVKRT